MLYRKSILILISIFILFIVYIFFSEIEIVSPGNGVIGGKLKNIDIVSPGSGFVNEINIIPGKFVKRGELLLSYQNVELFYKKKSTNNTIEDLKKNKKMLVSERVHLGEIIDSIDSDEFKSEIESRFNIDKPSLVRFTLKYNALVKKNKSLALELQFDDERKIKLLKILELSEEKLKLLINSKAPYVNIISAKSDIEKINSDLVDLNAVHLSKTQSFENEKYDFNFEIVKRIEDIDNDLMKIESNLIENESTMLSIMGKEKTNIVTAPVDGYLLALKNDFTIDTYISELQKIVSIKQAKTNSIIDGKVDTRYRPYIYIGAPVSVKVKSSAVKRDLKGVIENISVDSYDKYEQDPAKGRYYRVDVSLNDEYLSDYENLTGVDVDFYVISRKEPLISYITNIVKSGIYFTE